MKHSGSSIEGASVKRLRVDVPAGLAANPQAPMPKCSIEKFDKDPEGCPKGSEVGTTELEAAAEPLGLLAITLPKLEGKVYNLEAPAGLPLDFGIAVEPAGELITPHPSVPGRTPQLGEGTFAGSEGGAIGRLSRVFRNQRCS